MNIKIDETIKQIKTQISKGLIPKWPGPRKEVNHNLSNLHLMSILIQVISIIPKSITSVYELDFLICQFEIISNYIEFSLFSEIKLLLYRKRNIFDTIQTQLEVLKGTQLQSSLRSIHVPISDFEFIKRISSGGYARVFLGKKKIQAIFLQLKFNQKLEHIKKIFFKDS